MYLQHLKVCMSCVCALMCMQCCTGTGNTYDLPAWEGPGIWNYTETVEADSQFFYSGVPWDMVSSCCMTCLSKGQIAQPWRTALSLLHAGAALHSRLMTAPSLGTLLLLS